jgi:hypothetical protein
MSRRLSSEEREGAQVPRLRVVPSGQRGMPRQTACVGEMSCPGQQQTGWSGEARSMPSGQGVGQQPSFLR